MPVFKKSSGYDSFRLGLAIVGNLQEQMKADLAAGEKAVTDAIFEATEGLKNAYRQQVVGAGMGRRLANSWRSKHYPSRGKSLRAAGLVHSNAPEIISAHSESTVIRPTGTRNNFLAIPTKHAPRGRGGVRLSPADVGDRLGKLRVVKTKNSRVLLLVADQVKFTASGRVRRLSENRDRKTKAVFTNLRGRVSVVLFILVRQVRLRKRLDLDGPARVWLDRVPELIVRNWPDT